MNDALDAQSVSSESLLADAVDEFMEAVRRGESPKVEEYAARYPQVATLLRQVLPALQIINRQSIPSLAGGELEAPLDPSTGKLGDFLILREVGRGGMGVVYEAEQISLGRRVALKVLPFAATMDPRHLQRFQNEARAAACLHHTNIVPVFGVGQERGVHFYAMQFIEGQTLSGLIGEMRRQAGLKEPLAVSRAPNVAHREPDVAAATVPYASPVPETAPPAVATSTQSLAAFTTEWSRKSTAYFRSVAQLGIQAADALEYAHQMGVIHRDIKPANLIVDGHGTLWVTDFGLALCRTQEGLTMTGDLVGTLRYMSPEQALANRVIIDHRTDVYSLGVTLYEMLTLRVPFEGENRQELLRQIAFDEPRGPRKVNKSIPAELETIVLKAMERNPADRYAAARDVAEDLRRFVEDKPIRAKPPSLMQRARRWARRHRPVVWAAAVVAMILVTLVGVNGVLWAQKRTAGETAAYAALDEAARLADQERWPEAHSATKRAREVLAGIGANPDLRREVEELDKDVEMVLRLQEASLRRLADVKNAHLDLDATDAAYADAFQWYGLDFERLDSDEAAEFIRSRSISTQLVAALDDWATARREGHRAWRPILAVSRAADPDPWRNRVRDAWESQDHGTVEELLDSVPDKNLPAGTAVFVARMARGTTKAERAGDYLVGAQLHHPADFFLNEELGINFATRHPPRLDDATRYFSVAVALRPQSAGAHGNLGFVLCQKKRLEEAVEEFREAIKLDANSAKHHDGLGDALREKGQLEEAIKEYRQAIKLDTNFSRPHGGLGNALYDKRQLEEAIKEYRMALKLAPNQAVYHINLGEALYDKHELDEAIGEYEEAIKLNSRLVAAHLGLANARFAKKQPQEAIKACQEAIRLDPECASAHGNLGNFLSANGQHDSAIEEYHKAIKLDSRLCLPHHGLANISVAKGQFDEAIQECQEALHLSIFDTRISDRERAYMHNSLGVARLGRNKPDEAIKAFRVALKLDPKLGGAHFSLGKALEATGQLNAAIEEYEEDIKLDFRRVAPHLYLANALRTKGQFEDAIREYQEALHLSHIDNERASLLHNLGIARIAMKQPDEAITAFREALELDPKLVGTHLQLGIAFEAKGQLDRAIEEYKEEIKLDSRWAPHLRLANALVDTGQLDEAIRECQDAIRICISDKERASIHNCLGIAFDRNKQRDEAIKEFREAIRLDKDYATYHYSLGGALYMRKQLDEAIKEYLQAIHLKKNYAEAHCNLGHALRDQGRFSDALEALKRGHELGISDSRWHYPSAKWIQECELLLSVDRKLPDILSGHQQPTDVAERIPLAWLCQQPYKQRFLASYRFYVEAFTADPKLASDLERQHRYNAACAAALAGCGQGKDADQLDAEERARLRKQALDWLRADLRAWRDLLNEEKATVAPIVGQNTQHWLDDTDFNGVREAEALAKLPEAERADWQKLWDEVDALRQKAQPKEK
jgi:tetratricopeptide (TPR) repeat protein